MAAHREGEVTRERLSRRTGQGEKSTAVGRSWTSNAGIPSELPPTSLIIPSRNRPRLLFDAVVAILNGRETPSELIIVDDSDTPWSERHRLPAKGQCDVRYVWSGSSGLSRARNLGISLARHDLLVFTDDDLLAPPGWFGSLVRALLAEGDRAAATGRVLPLDAEVQGGFVPTVIIDGEAIVYQGNISKDVLASLNMALWRSAFDDAGLFDERLGPGTRFPAAEDSDLGYRLLRRGYRVIYAPDALLLHRAWRNQLVRMRWDYGLGQGAYYAKHLPARDADMVRRVRHDVGRHVRRLPRRLLSARRLAYGDIAYLLGMLTGAIEWSLTRQTAQQYKRA